MPFMPGNPGGGKRKEKLGYDALMLEMKAAEDLRGLRVIARKLLDLAANGDMQAIKEVFDRIDGKAIQQVDQNVDVRHYVAELPSVEATTDEWKQRHIPNHLQ